MTIEQLRALYAAACQRVQETADTIEALTDTASVEDVAAAETAHTEAVAEAERTSTAVSQREAVARARDQHQPTTTGERTETRVDVRVTRDERTYHPLSTTSFFRDLVSTKDGDPEARGRLVKGTFEAADDLLTRAREGSRPVEERLRLEGQARAISQTAGAGGEFVPPVWLNDQYAPLLRAGRAFADQCIRQPLIDGTNSINVPKITTGASTAVQADGASVSNTDLVTTSVTAQVQTIAGRTVASYQLIDMGVPGMDGVIYQDLLADYWRTLDTALINGNVVNAKGFLNLTGINAVTYTDATPTGPELYVPVFQAKSQIDKGAFAPVEFSLWHPSTWDWYLSQLDTQNRPLALAIDLPGFNQMAQFNPEAQGIAGNFGGIPVVIDANMPVNLGAGVNESRIGLFNRRTLYLYEGVPRFKVADQTSIANLQYQFVLYGYYGVALGRQPKMVSVISGTGLIVQAGF